MRNREIRKFEADEWKMYKDLRLASLRDSPDSFGSSLERELAFSDDDWKSRLTVSDTVELILPLVGFLNGWPAGLASGIVHEACSGVGHIYQMWVSPESRGAGLGKSLMIELMGWANSLALNTLRLSVTTTNTAAINLYASFGFVALGELAPLKDASPLFVQTMQWRLDACR